MNESAERHAGPDGASQDPLRPYILAAAALLVVIVTTAILIVTVGLPAFRGEGQETPAAAVTASATRAPTSTPSPTPEPIPAPSPWPAMAGLTMTEPEDPTFEFVSAGGRPGAEWTGFFGQVLGADDQPLPGVPVVVWAEDGHLAAPPSPTDRNGNYEIRLAGAPRAGTWTIQVLTGGWQPASKSFTFEMGADAETGIQQIQVIWKRLP